LAIVIDIPTLCDRIDDGSAADIVDCIDDAGKTAAVQALICTPTPCDDADIEINGVVADTVASGGSVNIITRGDNGDTFRPRSIDTSIPGDITLRWWIPAPMPATGTTLVRNNPFGNTNRFTDGNGLQVYGGGVWYAWDLTCWNESAEAYEVLEIETTTVAAGQWLAQTTAAAGVGKRMLKAAELVTLSDKTHATNSTTGWPTGALTGTLWLAEENAITTTQAWYVPSLITCGVAVLAKGSSTVTLRCRIRQFTISGSTITFL
jgi:hypothetical protein